MAVKEEEAPPPEMPLRDTILEVRTSKMKQFPNLKVMTGIMKERRPERVPVGQFGLDDDEHDPTFHGGIDKAVHHYDSSHYRDWATTYPESSHLFCPGGFGENLVTTRLNETNVCIGDVWRVKRVDRAPAPLQIPSSYALDPADDSVLLEVSIPRQPCFKLNHRFQIRNFAPQTVQRDAAGWYYRVLRGGSVGVGDDIELVARRHPGWTIAKVQHTLHRDTANAAALAALAAIPHLGDESKGRAAHLLAQHRQAAAAAQQHVLHDVRVVEKRAETPRVVALVLERVQPLPEDELPDVDGAYVRLQLGNGLSRCYSIVAGSANRFTLGVARDAASRGGSAWLHDDVAVGAVLGASAPVVSVDVDGMASRHVFVAGGIGITAFTQVMLAMARIHLNVDLHYAVRSAADDVPFRGLLDALAAESTATVTLYDGARGQRLDVGGVLAQRGWNAHVYVCGPARLRQGVQAAAAELRVPAAEIHYEAFSADTNGEPFDVVVREASGDDKKLHVGATETLLTVLREAGFDVPSSCEVGNCGTCSVTVCRGEVARRAMGDDENGERTMKSCVDRGVDEIEVDLNLS